MFKLILNLIVHTFLISSALLVAGQECKIDKKLQEEIASYQPTVNKIIDEITKGRFKGRTWDDLAEVTDFFGPRMSCSSALDKAIDYAVEKMKKDGLENVHTETAKLPHWVRNEEHAYLLQPFHKKLNIVGLGLSEPGNVTSEVVAVESFEEFDKLPADKVKGKIVVFSQKWTNYFEVNAYRHSTASKVAKKGGAAVLVKSLTQFSLGTPHTGHVLYEEGVAKIPAASITVEEAEMLLRMYRRGQKIEINLYLGCENKPQECESRNTIGEMEGSVYKNTSVVVLSGHYDSWDGGVGAMDDASGVMIAWKAVHFLKEMGLRPKRPIRAIAFTGEEIGLFGSQQYRDDHEPQEREEFNFFLEADSGTFEPTGIEVRGTPEMECIMQEILKLMKPISATKFQPGAVGGPDLTGWGDKGFPIGALLNQDENYFMYHHTEADHMTVWESKDTLDRCTALWAAASYVIADLSVDLPKDFK